MLEFGSELRRLGDEVTTFASDPRFVEAVRGAGLPAEPVRFGFDYHPATIARFRRRFRELGIEVACLNIHKELRTAGIAARWLGIPVVHRVGLPGDISGKWDQRLAHRWVVSRILVPSETMRRDLLAGNPFIAPEQVFAIPNGKRVTGRARTAMNRPVRFVMTSRLDAAKRHEDVLAVLAELLETAAPAGLPPFTLDIYGDGGQAEPLSRRIEELRLVGVVRLLGFRRDLPELLPGYDFGLLASENEGLPNTALEYLAAGLPVVATDTGGTAEAVRPGRNGWLFRPRDRAALRAHLLACLRCSESEYAARSARAISTMADEFNPASLARRLHDFFVETVAAAR